MKIRFPKSLHVILLIALLLYTMPPRVQACGPYSLRAVFTFSKHPDVPLDNFARGEIGALQPTYARSYLVAAYRHLNGTGLNAQEQKALVNFWKERLDFAWESPGEDTIAIWKQARGRVLTGSQVPQIEVFKAREKPYEYEQYLNCHQDAFKSAAATLEERIRRYGAHHPLLKDWVQAQDDVFSNCSEGRRVPAKLGSEADALLRADRNYQIAAALFYSSQFDEARRAFDEIAADRTSPWRQQAQYLVARTLVRQASLSEETEKAQAALQAEAQLNKILEDKSLVEFHPSSRRLLGLVRLRSHPEERLRELAGEVLRRDSQENIRQALWDYTFLLDRFEGEDTDEEPGKKFKDIPAVAGTDDLTDWVYTFQATDAPALEHALKKWGETSTDAWLVASLSKINAAHPKAGTLLAAGAKVQTESPAFAPVIFNSVRLLVEAGRDAEARAQLDGLLAQEKALFPRSTTNLLLGLRMKLARDLNEFLTYAQRVPSALSWDEDGREMVADVKDMDAPTQVSAKRVMFDADGIRIINEALPLTLLKEAASNKILPAHLRRDMAVAAWVRAVLYENSEVGREIAPVLESLAPELKGYLNEELSAAPLEARKFSALYAILKFPGMQPYVDAGLARQTPLGEMDSYRDNWWCAFDMEARPASSGGEAATEGNDASKSKSETRAHSFPGFLDEAQRAEVLRERAKLSALGTAPNYFCRLAIEWANKSPDDPRVPEALHLAVKSTRYGCPDAQTGALSKAAFQTLHKKYPNSSWAKKTPYWFNNS